MTGKVCLRRKSNIFSSQNTPGLTLVLLRRRLQGLFGCPFQLEVVVDC